MHRTSVHPEMGQSGRVHVSRRSRPVKRESSMEIVYPSILRRYFSTFIDLIFVLVILVLSSYFLDSDDIAATRIRVALILFMFFFYEPFLTAYFCTLGQRITGIRIRKLTTLNKISIIQAYIRIIIKIFLGIISFFSIPFSKNKRAIHDFVIGSIVIYESRKV